MNWWSYVILIAAVQLFFEICCRVKYSEFCKVNSNRQVNNLIKVKQLTIKELLLESLWLWAMESSACTAATENICKSWRSDMKSAWGLPNNCYAASVYPVCTVVQSSINAAYGVSYKPLIDWLLTQTRGQSNLTKSASRGAHSPVRGHPRGSKFVPLNSWGRDSY